MKKIVSIILVLAIVLSMNTAVAEALLPEATGVAMLQDGSLTMDCSNMNQGYIMVKAQQSSRRLKLRITSGDVSLNYDLNSSGEYEVFPLQLGTGEYQVSLWEQLSGKKYQQTGDIKFFAQMGDELSCFLYPNQYVNYTAETEAVITADKLCKGLSDPKQIYSAVKSYVRETLAYDFIKAGTVKPAVLPDIDGCWQKHMGICQDLSAVMVAMLRSQGVPARLVIGTLAGKPHAWVSAWVGDKWVSCDPTQALLGGTGAHKAERFY